MYCVKCGTLVPENAAMCPNCKELWIRCDAGEATFSRPCVNPLWEMEKKEAFKTL